MYIDVIGHVVLDDKTFYNDAGNRITERPNELGGPVSYVAIISPIFSLNYNFITSYGSDMPYEEFFNQINRIELNVIPSNNTTRFQHHIYPTFREMYVKSIAEELDELTISEKKGKSCLISPVFHEIAISTLKELQRFYNIMAVDAQGFLRALDNNKVVFLPNRTEIEWIINNVQIVKFSLREAQSYTKKNKIEEIFPELRGESTKIITAGKKGTYCEIEGKIVHYPAVKSLELDPTGAGDVFMGGLLSTYISKSNIELAIAMGMVLAAEKVKYYGIKMLPAKNYEKEAKILLENKKEP